MRLPILLLLLLLIHTSHSSSEEVEVDTTGQTSSSPSKPRIVSATFTNNLPSSTLNLYYTGSSPSSSPKLYYGPLEPNGGRRVLEQAYEDSVFVVTGEGGYRERISEFVLKGGEENVFEITEEEDHVDPFPLEAVGSLKREELSKQCRAAVTTSSDGSQLEDCQKCVSVPGCGYSPVRASSSSSSTSQQAVCFPSHSIATISSQTECTDLYAPPSSSSEGGGIIYNANTKSVNAWINLGTELMLGKQVQLHKFNVYYGGVGPKALRAAYRCLEMGVARATMDLKVLPPEEDKRKRTEVTLLYKRAKSTLMELEGKLEAVFDDTDAKELLDGSRHEALEDIFSKNDDGDGMPSVPRRTVEEAREYIIRGEPVVITNLFDGGDTTSPVPHKWTLEYLNQHIFGPSSDNNNNNDETTPKFNIAADQTFKCCQYYEPQSISQKAGYPYPFSPSTHLYRDTFDGFVKTVRKSNRNLYKVSDDGETVSVSSSGKRVLHYLHEIIMSDNNNDNEDGEVITVAGGPAPPIFQTQIQTTLQHLHTSTIATNQPFFGKFASSKLWIGQKNIIMPLHYDSTDNLYVMAWGRKRAIIGEPGQLDSLYRYPNQHPLAGSSQVNLTQPDILTKYPNFKDAKLREVIVGPGDVLYLPAWWWHQFEQPFEDTAALNVWSVDREQAPDVSMRDVRVRELLLADQLEGAVVDLFGVEAGVVLEALAATTTGTTGGDDEDEEEKKGTYVELEKEQKDEAMKALYGAANSWRQGVTDLSGITPKASHSAESLVKTYLSVTYKEVMKKEDHFVPGWRPGDKWDLSRSATLPRDLRERCEEAPESSPFMSICA